jgi:hypothetical protein
MTEIVAVVCGVVAVAAIVVFERASRKAAQAVVRATAEWANRSVESARIDAAETRRWFSEELRLAREENGRLTRLLESRNLAEFTSAEEQLARARGVRVPEAPRKPNALQEMWADKPPVDAGKKENGS